MLFDVFQPRFAHTTWMFSVLQLTHNVLYHTVLSDGYKIVIESEMDMSKGRHIHDILYHTVLSCISYILNNVLKTPSIQTSICLLSKYCSPAHSTNNLMYIIQIPKTSCAISKSNYLFQSNRHHLFRRYPITNIHHQSSLGQNIMTHMITIRVITARDNHPMFLCSL